MLTGALLGAVATKDTSAKEGWRKAGASFFKRGARKAAAGPDRSAANDTAPDRNAASSCTDAGADRHGRLADQASRTHAPTCRAGRHRCEGGAGRTRGRCPRDSLRRITSYE